MSSNVTFCNLKQFSKDFRSYHIYLSFFICTLGSILNTLNIYILSTKQIRSPTNYILTALATADVIVMLEYMPFSYLQDKGTSYYFTYNFASFLIFHAVFTNAFHFISCSLAIILAIWRYIAVKFPQNNQDWCDESRTKYTIVCTYLFCACVCTPLLVSMKINEQDAFQMTNGTIVLNKTLVSNMSDIKNFTIYFTNYRNTIFRDISFYVYGIVLKLIPCILLVMLSTFLVIELFKANQRRKALHQTDCNKSNLLKKKLNHKHADKEKQFNRTTKMLLAVLLLFLMAEFPQAMMGLLLQILGEKFSKECYGPLGDLLDIFTLTISAINFVLYCIMSQKFRDVFRQQFMSFLPCGKALKNQWGSLQAINTAV